MKCAFPWLLALIPLVAQQTEVSPDTLVLRTGETIPRKLDVLN